MEVLQTGRELLCEGCEFVPRSIHYEAAMQEDFPGGQVPSVPTIARHLASVGQVDVSPKKRPRSSYIPFVRANPMSLWQLDAFEYSLSTGTVITIYQVLDDASRFDVGTQAHTLHENSSDAEKVLKRAIGEYGAPKELLSDNSSAFNQLRQGRVGSVEVYLASKGTMPITGFPGRPTTQGKTERSHQTLTRFLDANPPATLAQARRRIAVFREHYNTRRPHQSLGQATPAEAWDLLEHTPATKPIPLVVLEAKAKAYLNRRRISASTLYRAHLMVTKDGTVTPSQFGEDVADREIDEAIITVTKENHQVYYKGLQIKLPAHYGDREYYRTISEDEFLVADPRTGEVIFSFPLPMLALRVNGRYIASYAIRGVYLSHPTPHWLRKIEEFQGAFVRQELETPEAFKNP